MQLKEKCRDNNSIKTEDVRNRTPYRKEDDEIDLYSSYSESDLRLQKYPKQNYRNDFLAKRNMPLQYHNQESKKGPTHYNNHNNAPYSPKFVKHEALPGYELPYHPYYKSTNDRSSRNYTKTKRRAGEVIPRKTSTEWMCNMGIVGDLLTEKDANDSFKKAAG
ncbi:hypothetical protein CEXT_349121 [Caerostris extrusa]|uniref:Uncharacterized protein n=1 Tax=Caerostris extrusa TaxID=172846 RepID=A0AAV4P4Z0_CAEEX|nr:hypothetical protein CEXT_349121 [Caerostris extrusa]